VYLITSYYVWYGILALDLSLVNRCIGKISIFTVLLFLKLNVHLPSLYMTFCTGPYKNESLFTSLHSTEELYSEEYILLVNPTSPGFSGYVSAPFRPIGYNQLSIRSPLPIIA